MSRTTRDVLLSLSNYVSKGLPDYSIYLYDLIHGELQRPAAVVRDLDTASGEPGGWAMVDMVAPYVVYAFPPDDSDPEKSVEMKDYCRQQLIDLFERGVDKGARRRVPLYDFTGLTLDDPLPQNAEPEGMLRLSDVSVRAVRDDAENTAWNVTCSIRVQYRMLGPRLLGPLVEEVRAEYDVI